jgi:hypothetical protein
VALNSFGEQIARQVTLVPLKLLPIDDAAERREIAERLAQDRIIRLGRDKWAEIAKCESFDAWLAIGHALSIGRDYALRSTGANAPMGRPYSWVFSAWCKKHGFTMRPAIRSWCLALHENAAAITAWREKLPAGRGRRLPVNPQSLVKGWQRSLTNGNGHAAPDWKREAIAAYRRFLNCLAALSPADQALVWQAVNQTQVRDAAAA